MLATSSRDDRQFHCVTFWFLMMHLSFIFSSCPCFMFWILFFLKFDGFWSHNSIWNSMSPVRQHMASDGWSIWVPTSSLEGQIPLWMVQQIPSDIGMLQRRLRVQGRNPTKQRLLTAQGGFLPWGKMLRELLHASIAGFGVNMLKWGLIIFLPRQCSAISLTVISCSHMLIFRGGKNLYA